jgi:hypothetical protein
MTSERGIQLAGKVCPYVSITVEFIAPRIAIQTLTGSMHAPNSASYWYNCDTDRFAVMDGTAEGRPIAETPTLRALLTASLAQMEAAAALGSENRAAFVNAMIEGGRKRKVA